LSILRCTPLTTRIPQHHLITCLISNFKLSILGEYFLLASVHPLKKIVNLKMNYQSNFLLMLPRNFLTQMAHEHELSAEQKDVFLMRVADSRSYEQIASELGTSADACLKRMGQVYLKFNISGNSRGKENKLRIFLLNKLEKVQENSRQFAANQSTNFLQKNTNSDSVGTIDKATKPAIFQTVFQNLPAREYTNFVGRNEEFSRLIELLDFQHSAHLISVDGIGGVGKTTLAIEVAYRCLHESKKQNIFAHNLPIFQAIIFTSAKQNHLTAIGLLPRLTFQRTLRDICREIAYTLDCSEFTNLLFSEQIQQIRQKLSQIKTLLIVDNLETIEDKQEVLSFLYDLPPTVKVIITTRDQALFVPIRLGCLPKKHCLSLIQQETKEKNVYLDAEQSQQLFEGVSGIPAAIIYAIGQISTGYLLEDVLSQIKHHDGDVARFCFSGAVTPLRGTPTYDLLMALALFVQPATRDAIAAIAFEEVDSIITSQGLAKLQQLSLVSQQQGRYSLLEITREYTLAELAASSEFSQQLRQRWVSWYIKFSEAYGGSNWKEWHLGYGHLEVEWENLRTVLEWCIAKVRYADVGRIWQHIKGYIRVRGYWDEGLAWTAWLIESAKQAGDLAFAVEVMSDRARTLIDMRSPGTMEEAEGILQAAWELRHQQTGKFQLELVTNLVILNILQQNLPQARSWLDVEQSLLEEFGLTELEVREQQVHIFYYQGQIHWQLGDYQEAEAVFLQALELAIACGWQKATAAIHNWLGEVAIALGNFEEARRLLDLSFPMAERHKDKRSIAFHKATFAKLEKRLGRLTEAKRFAMEAAEEFEGLKMTAQAEEMRCLFSD
jgi:tetratricopeptide (TPR) repeat protein